MKQCDDIKQKKKYDKNSSHITLKSEPALCSGFLRAGLEMKLLSLAENIDRAEVTCHEDGDKME